MMPPDPHARRRRLEGIVALLFVQLFFGMFPLAVKFVHGESGAGFSPRAIAVWRMLFGGGSFLALAFWQYGRAAFPARADLTRLFLCSLLGVVINQVLALEGMVRSTVTNAGLLMTLIPVFTYGLAVLVRQESIRLQRAGGIAIAMFGATLLILRDRGGTELAGENLLGNLLIVANCLSYAGYLIVAGPLLTRIPALVLIAWVFVLSWTMLPFVGWGAELWPRSATPETWGWMAFILLFPTSIAYFLNTYALARVSASTTAVFIYLQPLVAGAGGVLVLDERLGWTAVGAALLLFLGIGLVVLRPARASAPPPPPPTATTLPGRAPAVRSSDEPVA